METTLRREAETPTQNLGGKTLRADGLAELGEKGNGEQLRATVRTALEKAKAVCQQLQQKTAATAKAANRTVHAHPYRTAGIALGVGLLVGLLAVRRSRSA